MNKIKAALAFALALSMCASLAACGNSDDGKSESATTTTTTAAAKADDTPAETEKADKPAEDAGADSAAEDQSAEDTSSEAQEFNTSLSLAECESVSDEVNAAANIAEAEEILSKTFDIDISGKNVVEEHDTVEVEGFDHDSYIAEYTLNTPVDLFGNDKNGNPMPLVSSITLVSETADTAPYQVKFTLKDSLDKSRAEELDSSIEDSISAKYGEKKSSYWTVADKSSFFVQSHSDYDDAGEEWAYTIEFHYDGDTYGIS